ncbi:MAG: ThiF family adenylyltransferase [Methyloprofundus sp.]|nr:ThiF family adenylyltransferase [Methyloprofundus sp.]
MNNLRLRRSIGIVITEQHVDFFKSNTRESLLLKMNNKKIVELLQDFNGSTTVDEICERYQLDATQLESLLTYLHKEHILIQQDANYPTELIQNKIRLVNLLEDYCHSTSEVIKAINKLSLKKVMIIGLGAVGSFVAVQLAQLGVGNLIFVDKDKVDESNLHRQYYFEDNIGKLKTEVLKNEISKINPCCNIEIIHSYLNLDFFDNHDIPIDIDLIINCADEPSVDATSKIVSEYAMRACIPHIVGGGYNLHLTLIGQTIIPYKTACFECFNIFLKKINDFENKNIKKLHRENRKLGSFSPLSGIASNLASLDAFKVLIEKTDKLQQTNKRIEFNTGTNNFTVMQVERSKECKWCGNNVE